MTDPVTDPIPARSPVAGIGRVVTAMVTPFTADGELDLDGAQRVADHLVATGTETVLVNGTTGESPTMRDDEGWQVLAAVREAVSGRATVMCGTGNNDTYKTARFTEQATQLGADAVLVVTPYYNRPDQRGLLAHFRAAAAATDLPVVLYDIAMRTGREIAVDTLAELAQVDNIVGVKDASHDGAKVGDVLLATAGAPGGFGVWSGADEFNLSCVATGGVGVISVSSHLVGRQIAEMIDVFPSDPNRAAQLHLACLPLHRALFAQPSPAPLKAAMMARGLPGGPVRPPLADASPEVVDRVLAALDGVSDALDRRVDASGVRA